MAREGIGGVEGGSKGEWAPTSKNTKIAIITLVVLIILEGAATGVYFYDQSCPWIPTLTDTEKMGICFGGPVGLSLLTLLFSKLFIQEPKAYKIKHAQKGIHRAPGLLCEKNAVAHMVRNTKKAFTEAAERYSGKKTSEDPAHYKVFRESEITTEGISKFQKPLSAFEHANVNSCLYEEDEAGILVGIFEGHGGDGVADYLLQNFYSYFSNKLKALQGNVHATFEVVMAELQAEICGHQEWKKMGSTALVSYIDKKKGLIYTATLGQAEAFLYQDINTEGTEKLLATPLSCVRNWESKRERQRMKGAPEQFKIEEHDIKLTYRDGEKEYETGLDVSRAFGDARFAGLVIQKPKITIEEMKGLVILASVDFLNKTTPIQRAKIIEENITKTPTAIAKALTITCDDKSKVLVIRAN